jgi:hypothetical protein
MRKKSLWTGIIFLAVGVAITAMGAAGRGGQQEEQERREVGRQVEETSEEARCDQIFEVRNAQAEDLVAKLTAERDAPRPCTGFCAKCERWDALQGTTFRVDPVANTLTVNVSPGQCGALERIVAELDVPLPQVFIEMLLAEVRLDEGERQLSAKSLGLEDEDSTRTCNVFHLPETQTSAWVRNLQVEDRIELHSRPTVVATDGEPIRVSINKNEIVVTPVFNHDGSCTLRVMHEVSETCEGGKIVNSQSIETSLVIKNNGETYVIGGIVSKENDRGAGNVSRPRVESLVIITPHVLSPNAKIDR